MKSSNNQKIGYFEEREPSDYVVFELLTYDPAGLQNLNRLQVTENASSSSSRYNYSRSYWTKSS